MASIIFWWVPFFLSPSTYRSPMHSLVVSAKNTPPACFLNADTVLPEIWKTTPNFETMASIIFWWVPFFLSQKTYHSLYFSTILCYNILNKSTLGGIASGDHGIAQPDVVFFKNVAFKIG